MGGAISSLGSGIAYVTPGVLKGIVKRAGLPLEVDDDNELFAQELNEPSKVRLSQLHPPSPPHTHTLNLLAFRIWNLLSLPPRSSRKQELSCML